ncbi:MAG TPA: metallophosphoesterase [Candidatus Tectomicrobia bacterium]|nr:metallophosphoesterase [Candidatus Tectomicrobia bacterium]
MPSSNGPRDLGRHLFDIAVVADTHLNEAEHVSGSPYECNRVANARTRYVVERLNQLRPALTIHLGDLVHPVPSLPTYEQAAANFHELTSALQSPLRLVPGNHDVGDKPVVWAPAGTVSEASLALWTRHFGPHYYGFDFRGIRFVVIDAQIINSGLAAERAQRAWLEDDLAQHAGRRTFVCMHYPPYVSEPDEAESYDNLGEPGRSWLLALIERYRPEALFCGHVHNVWYNRHGETDVYILPSTAFVRHDYSELARVGPAAERGRNDLPKLGFFLVKIHERGHVCHVERTYGATLEPGARLPAPVEQVPAVHAWARPQASLGVDLRHPWAEVVEIPPTGALDEFERKRVRNDYPLLALWEMGIGRLRVPFQDLEDPRTRERMRILRRAGHAFIVYTLGVPTGRARDLLIASHDLVDTWEVVFPWSDLERTVSAIRDVKAKAPLRVYVSKLRMKEDARAEGSRYYHFINHGFVVAERAELEASWRSDHGRDAVDGVVFRVARHASPWLDIMAADAIAADLGIGSIVHIRMASTNPAEEFTDDLANASRVAEALAAAAAESAAGAPLQVVIDTFADIDRGYFVRHGLVDRRWNPRLASHVVRNLTGALGASGGPLKRGPLVEMPSGRVCLLEGTGGLLAVVLPERPLRLDRVPATASAASGRCGTGRWIDLASGTISALPWERTEDGWALPGGRGCEAPALMVLG